MRLTLYTLLVLVIVLPSFFLLNQARNRHIVETLPKYISMPALELTASNNKKFSRGDLLGKTTVLNFFFTSCQGICPTVTGNIAKLHRKYLRHNGFQMVSVSVDPERDTLSELTSYAERFKANISKWHFLRGDKEQVELLLNATKLGVPDEITNHSTRVVLIDKEGYVRGYYQGLDPKMTPELEDHIDALLQF